MMLCLKVHVSLSYTSLQRTENNRDCFKETSMDTSVNRS